jgi:hypothetical protein
VQTGITVPDDRSAPSTDSIARIASTSWEAAARRAAADRVRADAKQALVTLGFRAVVATEAIDAAVQHLGPKPEVATFIAEALRRCARPIERVEYAARRR